jgi:hypothetical protein
MSQPSQDTRGSTRMFLKLLTAAGVVGGLGVAPQSAAAQIAPGAAGQPCSEHQGSAVTPIAQRYGILRQHLRYAYTTDTCIKI